MCRRLWEGVIKTLKKYETERAGEARTEWEAERGGSDKDMGEVKE